MDHALLVRLIILLPLAGAVLNGILPLFFKGLRREGLNGTLGTAVVALPFLLTAYLFAQFDGEAIVVPFFEWMRAGDLSLSFAYRIDQLSLVMTLIVTGVGALIHLYSMGYMHDDPGYWRFFAYLNLFIFAMLNLVLGDNLVVLFLGWEGVGLCSYLLIGFWYTDLKNSQAANKAFIVNRIGDFAFLVALFILFRYLGSLDFSAVLSGAVSLPESVRNWVVLLFFIGATGKSAQIPLFVWLPDAMAGPTPVSALIHAATMVTSGLYLLARLSPLVLSAPLIMPVIAIVAALTAIMAATIAITQYDIKKVLAYSTVSQLGFMFMAAGVGAFYVAIFHVMTHAFFKACLFLGSGSVIHAMHHVEHDLDHRGLLKGHFDPQDMRNMGGLRKYMPTTSWTYLVSMLAIAGIPPLSGFFSKDEILYRAFEYGYNGHFYAWLVWGVGIVTALLTAFYMSRSYVLTFLGKERWPASDQVHPHESPWTMTLPLVVLASLAAVGGFLGIPAIIQHGELNWIHHYLAGEHGPVADAMSHAAQATGNGDMMLYEILLIVLGGTIAVVGVLWGWRAYTRHGVAYDDRLRAAFGGLYRLASQKYRWDEMYDRVVVRPIIGGSYKGLQPFDAGFVDGAVNGVARLVKGLSAMLRPIQNGIVQTYAMAVVLGVVLVLALMLFAA